MTQPRPKRKFVPRAVLMKFGLKILNTAGQSSSRAALSVNTARPINTTYPRPTVNYARPTSNVFNRAHWKWIYDQKGQKRSKNDKKSMGMERA
ncbi:hypothetical protein Tco_0362588 [Tanacetum coccineum]